MTCLKNGCRKLLAYILWVLIAALVGTGLLTAVYLLPADAMANHMDASAEVILREGEYPQLYSWCTSQLDNYTDAIILMNAAYDSGEPAVTQAMAAARPHIQGMSTPVDVLEAHYENGIPYDAAEPYYQYWHGYLLFVRPLLLLTDYSGIRILNAVVQTALLALLLVLMVRKGKKRYLLPYLISLAFLMPAALVKSMQFSSCYYILTLGVIAVLLSEKQPEGKDAFVFLFIGIATAYFDFLTYPIATLGIPAAFYFVVRHRMSVKEAFCKGVKLCFAWGFGYAAMWAGKWFIGSLITGRNILTIATAKLTERSSLNVAAGESLLFNMRVALGVNVKAFLRTPAALLLLIAAAAALAVLIAGYKKHRFRVGDMAVSFFPFVILAVMPLVWYAFTANHSSIHYWFTNKALVVSVFAALCAPVKLLEGSRQPGADNENGDRRR